VYKIFVVKFFVESVIGLKCYFRFSRLYLRTSHVTRELSKYIIIIYRYCKNKTKKYILTILLAHQPVLRCINNNVKNMSYQLRDDNPKRTVFPFYNLRNRDFLLFNYSTSGNSRMLI